MKENKMTQAQEPKETLGQKKGLSFYTLIVWMVVAFLVFLFCVLLFCLTPILETVGAPLIIFTGIGFLILECILGFISGRLFHKQMRINTLEAALDMDMEFHQILDKWTDPIILFGSDGRVTWRNEAFVAIEEDGEILGKRMEDLGLGLEGLRFEADKAPVDGTIRWNNRDYTFILRAVVLEEPVVDHYQKTDSKVYMLTLRDVTLINKLTKENLDLQPVVLNMRVDNYETILEDLEETEKPMVISNLYQAMANLSGQTNGVLLQPADDRFVLAFHHDKLEPLEDGKFKILNEVRDILKSSTNATVPLTLSVGVGTAYQMEKAFALSKEAMQLAARRGGDQAVIKDNDSTRYAGGKSNAVESDSQVKARYMAGKLEELINQSDRVIVMGHKNMDLDALGSALGLYRMAKLLNEKPAYIVMSKNMDAVRFLYDRLAAQPEADTILIDEHKALEYLNEGQTLLIVTDVNVPKMVESESVLSRAMESDGARIAVIDHHRSGENQISIAELSYVDPAISSASEMVTELLQYISIRPRLTYEEADGLLAGITLDTKNFMVHSGVRSFEAAAFLRRNGADPERVKALFKQTYDEFQIRNKLIHHAVMMGDDVLVTYWESDNSNWKALAASVADELLEVSGINMSVAITKTEEGITVSARSNSFYNVQRILEDIPANEETCLVSAGGNAASAAAQFTKEATKELVEGLIEKSIQKIKEELA